MVELVALGRTGLTAFFDWWFKELAGLVPRSLLPSGRRGRRRLILMLADGGATLLQGGGGDGQPLGQVDDLETPEPLSALLRQARARKRPLTVRLAADLGLRKTLTLPLAARADLAQLLRFEMDRLTPFQADEVYFAHRLLTTDTANRRIQVELHVAPKSVVEHGLDLARQHGIEPDRVELGQLQDASADAPNLLPVDATSRRGSSRLGQVFAVVAALLALVAVGIPIWQQRSTATALEAEVTDAKARAEKSLAMRTRLDEIATSAAFLDQHKAERPMITNILAALTEALPDQAHVMQLDWRDGTLQVHGYAEAAHELIPILDRTPVFTAPQFRSPVTPDPRLGLERFHLSLELAAEAE